MACQTRDNRVACRRVDGENKRSDRITGPNSPAFRALREELICSHIPPVDIPLLTEVDRFDSINGLFSNQ